MSFETAPGPASAPSILARVEQKKETLDDPIAQKLEKARKEYQVRAEKARAQLLNDFNRVEKLVRRQADPDLLKKLRQQRKELEEQGRLPDAIDTTRYVADFSKARTAYARELDTAAEAHVRSGKADDPGGVVLPGFRPRRGRRSAV